MKRSSALSGAWCDRRLAAGADQCPRRRRGGGRLRRGGAGVALGINDQGVVVGASLEANFNSRAFVWEKGVMTDLNTLIPANSALYLLLAMSINSSGEIVGLAFDTSDSQAHGFLATPIHSEAGSKIAAPAAQGETSESPDVASPENLREALQHRLRFGRFGFPLTGRR